MGAREQLRIDTRHEVGRVIFGLSGELDMASAGLLQQAIESEDVQGEAMVVLDLQRLQFIDSTGLRIILTAYERCRERRQAFAITPGSPQVQRLLSVTGMGEYLPTIAAADEVLAT
jgi:anti-sigma B factor antagonist